MTTLKAGDTAPDFTGTLQDGSTVSLADYAGRKLIIFFYPKDDTPGCTAAACSLRDGYAELRARGYELLGVSPDSPAKHQKFITKYQLPMPLLADEEHRMMDAYGTWGPKKFMGRSFDGVLRTTVVIDAAGKIDRVYTKVNTSEHADQILADEPKA
ncbi:thioredoxin-dependent thiol peroxidase [Neolewinella lacunae]|uniref:thioredoxin-dependent peroxiredoxin n=1 Tax=Neolewinella lacunae TaxID=1517758 RepID=A0A923PP18_9BACT|nr:thioredoxin-dependent thiol peroxidase [Neolewinella lacunae]MBC6994788.1 thioredoxin-dependent thiol peroxidase [Neolewinella lacunae]MDN3634410.1 thioredoxin-dependent thiol peroxidase [Neolewinella lacunae]